MSLTLRAADGTAAEWRPAGAPRVLLRADSSGAAPAAAARLAACAQAVEAALRFLGYEPIPADGDEPDLVLSLQPGPGARLVLGATSAAAADYRARGLSEAEFRYLCLKTHPRAPLSCGGGAMAEAQRELAWLRTAATTHAAVTLEPSSRGFAGYQLRLRDALSRDFDFPAALGCLMDGLRPGALSPGSRAALLRAGLPAFGL